uniref:Uncharacterized protein n=1 Tax=Rhizophora mucronata TaxID=61149 RepID=A0A2P2K0W9_RHIMU
MKRRQRNFRKDKKKTPK